MSASDGSNGTKSLYGDKERASEFWVQKYERDARKNWDVFYKNNGDRFFKDRHYFRREWARVFPAAAAGDDVNDASSDSDDSDSDVDPLEKAGNVERIKTNDEEPIEVGPAPRYAIPDTLIPPFPGRVFLEIGCGVGNSAFPLLDLDPTATVYCCDFSQRAVSLVESRRAQLPLDKANRIRPFVCDVSREPMANTHIPPGCVDVCTMVFVLSAIAPERMPDAIRNVSSVMRTGGQGRVLLRDYAAGDLAQTRLGTRDGRKLGDNFYVRGDGTRAYYFENRFIKRLFTDRGMPLEELQVHERAITNRGKGQRMERRWVQCIFASAEVPEAPLPPPPPPPEPEWQKRARAAETARAAEATRSEAARAQAELDEREEGEKTKAIVAKCDRVELEKFINELRVTGRVDLEEIVTRLG